MNTPTPKRRLNRLVLLGSLALNVLLIGLVVGSIVAGKSGPPRGFDAEFGAISEMLSVDDRRAIGREIRREIRASGFRRPDRNAAVASIVGTLEAETFDTASFISSFEAQKVQFDTMRQIAVKTIADHISQMDVEERRDLATRLRDRVGGRSAGRD